MFGFVICPSTGGAGAFGFSDNQPLQLFNKRSNAISREKLLEECRTTHGSCAGLLMYDNWEFKDDCPHKL